MSKQIDIVVALQEDGTIVIDWGSTYARWEDHGGSVWDEDESEHRYTEDGEQVWADKGLDKLEQALEKIV